MWESIIGFNLLPCRVAFFFRHADAPKFAPKAPAQPPVATGGSLQIITVIRLISLFGQ